MFDPQRMRIFGRRRHGGVLVRIPKMHGWVSPILQIGFELSNELALFRPNGERFISFEELERARHSERARAEQERQRAEQERQRAERAEAENQRLRALLKDKGVDPNHSS